MPSRRLCAARRAFRAALILGILWGLCNAPVVDFLGAASPQGTSWLPFLLAFVALVTAMRILIAWIYVNTESVLLTQLMHASSTGCLVILSSMHVSPAQEALWYAIYAALRWGLVAIVTTFFGKELRRSGERSSAGTYG